LWRVSQLPLPGQPVTVQPGGIQILPIQGGANGVIQFQVQPGNVQVIPALPAIPAEKVPAKPEK
jgi:hypothetical protein